MSTAVIGALRVNLGIDSAAFDKGIDNAKGKLSGFGRALANVQNYTDAAGKAFSKFGSQTARVASAMRATTLSLERAGIISEETAQKITGFSNTLSTLSGFLIMAGRLSRGSALSSPP